MFLRFEPREFSFENCVDLALLSGVNHANRQRLEHHRKRVIGARLVATSHEYTAK